MEFRVSDLPRTEQPEYKVLINPKNANLSELISVIIGNQGSKNSLVTANNIIVKFPDLNITVQDLLDIGLSTSQSARLLSAIQLTSYTQPRDKVKDKSNLVTAPDIAFEILKKECKDFNKEHFLVISLDSRNNFIAVDTISIGTLTASLVHPRELFESAIKRHAAHILIAHNHPSGETDPSEDDLKITRRLVDAGKIMGIAVLDHIIFTKEKFRSFKESSLM